MPVIGLCISIHHVHTDFTTTPAHYYSLVLSAQFKGLTAFWSLCAGHWSKQCPNSKIDWSNSTVRTGHCSHRQPSVLTQPQAMQLQYTQHNSLHAKNGRLSVATAPIVKPWRKTCMLTCVHNKHVLCNVLSTNPATYPDTAMYIHRSIPSSFVTRLKPQACRARPVVPNPCPRTYVSQCQRLKAGPTGFQPQHQGFCTVAQSAGLMRCADPRAPAGS